MISALVLLGVVFSTMTFVWLTVYAMVTATASGVLSESRWRRAIEAVSGIILIALGVRVAADAR